MSVTHGQVALARRSSTDARHSSGGHAEVELQSIHVLVTHAADRSTYAVQLIIRSNGVSNESNSRASRTSTDERHTSGGHAEVELQRIHILATHATDRLTYPVQ